MTTKLWIYIFTLIGGIIQISLQTYKGIPDDFYVICFTIAGALTITLTTISKNTRIKDFGEDTTLALFVLLALYFITHDCATIFKQFGDYWFYIIAVIIAHRTYEESKETHRRNLIQYSDTLLKIINSYISHHIDTLRDRDSLVFQIWFSDMDKAQKNLRKELYEGNRVSDFSFKEWWFERERFINSLLPQKFINHQNIPFKKYTLHETVKLAEEVARCHHDFAAAINNINRNNLHEYNIEINHILQTGSELQEILSDMRRRYDGPYDLYDHNLRERLHNNEEAPVPQTP